LNLNEDLKWNIFSSPSEDLPIMENIDDRALKSLLIVIEEETSPDDMMMQ